MNDLVKIDSELLAAEVTKLNGVTTKLIELFDEIKKETDSMKEVWETKTSESVYMDFENFYKLGESVVSVNENDAKFLDAVVKANYVNFDEKTDKLVDSNIAI